MGAGEMRREGVRMWHLHGLELLLLVAHALERAGAGRLLAPSHGVHLGDRAGAGLPVGLASLEGMEMTFGFVRYPG